MGRKPKSGRPKPFGVADVRVRVIRGPKDGRWYWRAELHLDDGRTLWTGWASRTEAQQIVAEIVAGGIAPKKAKASDGMHPEDVRLVADLLDVWIGMQEQRADIVERSLIVYKRSADRLEEVIGHVPLAQLRQRTLELYRDTQLGKGLAPRTVATDLERLAAAWKWGRAVAVVPPEDLPVVTVRLPSSPKRTPSAGEVARVIDAISIPWRRLAVRLLYATGARIGEIAFLTWDDVDLEEGVLYLDGKTGPRMAPLLPEVVAELREWRASMHPPTLEVLGVTYNTVRVNVQRALDEACTAAGVRRFTSHALRRAAVDHLQRCGVDVATAAALLGHTPGTMLKYYRQASASDVRAAVLRSRLGALPEGKVIQMRAAGEPEPHNFNRTHETEPDEPPET